MIPVTSTIGFATRRTVTMLSEITTRNTRIATPPSTEEAWVRVVAASREAVSEASVMCRIAASVAALSSPRTVRAWLYQRSLLLIASAISTWAAES